MEQTVVVLSVCPSARRLIYNECEFYLTPPLSPSILFLIGWVISRILPLRLINSIWMDPFCKRTFYATYTCIRIRIIFIEPSIWRVDVHPKVYLAPRSIEGYIAAMYNFKINFKPHLFILILFIRVHVKIPGQMGKQRVNSFRSTANLIQLEWIFVKRVTRKSQFYTCL